MASYCLLPKYADDFKARLKDGRIDPKKLAEMSSKERHTFFEEFLGKHNAKNVNALFESKMLLKNQQAGFISWAKKVAGLTKEQRRDLISKIEKIDKVLDTAEQGKFLADLAEKKLGVGITEVEAKQISEMSGKIKETGSKMNEDFTFDSFEDRMAHGRAKVDLLDYVGSLKEKANKLTLEDLKNSPVGTSIKAISRQGGLLKSLKASLDNSVIGRQGIKTMFTNPRTWIKNSAKTFVDIYKELKGEDAMREIRAEVMSRPNALNGLYAKEKLAVGVVEEAYPSHAPAKIPVLGRLFKASEAAFTGFQYRTRADVFDKYVQIAEKSGADIMGIGRIANSLTGRGNLGFAEKIAGEVNNLFFSPRFMKANFDTLTGHVTEYKYMSPFARKQAAINTVKVVAGVTAILAIADAVMPGSVEKDPTSSDFGKIRIGDTRFDVTGGMSGIATLAMRQKRGYKKSSTTGKITRLDEAKFGQDDRLDVIFDFFLNKASPAAAVVRDWAKGRDFDGNKPTIPSSLNTAFTPLPITQYQSFKENQDDVPLWVKLLSEALGIGTNSY